MSRGSCRSPKTGSKAVYQNETTAIDDARARSEEYGYRLNHYWCKRHAGWHIGRQPVMWIPWHLRHDWMNMELELGRRAASCMWSENGEWRGYDEGARKARRFFAIVNRFRWMEVNQRKVGLKKLRQKIVGKWKEVL